ncbi:CPK17 [Scenedesmus sp. PABB004]|nr:CPK17 [Scenedesmus sp. PABB004]
MGLCASAPVADAAPADGGGERSAAAAAPAAAARDRRADGAAARPGGGGGGQCILGRLDDVRARYTFDKVLGKGQFGVTRLVTDTTTGEACACKSISKRKLVSAEDAEDVRREIKVMHHLSGHQHVVQFKGAYEDAHHVHILSAKGHYRERDAAAIMRTMLQVVQHCHSMNVVHRDLKPENFLFKDAGKHTLKAIDFGLSAFFVEGSVLHDLVGSPFYMAPEVLRRGYGKAADVWSCGVIMYILLCGWPPFYGSNAQQIFRAVLHDSLDLASPPWDSISPQVPLTPSCRARRAARAAPRAPRTGCRRSRAPAAAVAGTQAKDCVKRMLVRDPRKRADTASILGHEWMQGGASGAPEAPMQPEILARLRQFAGMNRFKKEALRVVAAHLPPEEIEGIRQMFMDLDRDSSGTISFGLRRKGASVADAELQRIMGSVDLDGNHTLDFQARARAQPPQRQQAPGAAALRAEGVSCGAIASILADVDRDNDRRIDYDEFARMMLGADDAAARNAPPSHGGADPHAGGHGRPGAGHSPQPVNGDGCAHLPGSAGHKGDASGRVPVKLGSQARHTLHGVKSGAWMGQLRATEQALEQAVEEAGSPWTSAADG